MGNTKTKASLFELDGIPAFGQALPLALQHVVAMIVGCVTPAIMISSAAGVSGADKVILLQAPLVISALSTLLQLFPIGKKNGFHLGSGLPVIIGVSFAYVPSMQAIAEGYDINTILGAQIIGGVVAGLVGIFIKKIRKFFPPLIAGTVVFTIGLSLYPTAINYMAGGVGSSDYGSMKNWLLAIFTLVVVTMLNHFGKGIFKLASILIGMAVGYVAAFFMGMVNFNSVAEAGIIQLPKLFHFPVRFEISNGENRARCRPRGAVVASGDPRRGKVIGGYLRDQYTVPRLWVVVVVAGEHRVDGGPCSGGRQFGRGRSSPERAARFKLTRGLGC